MNAPAELTAFQGRYYLEQMIFGDQIWRYRQTAPGAPVLLALPGALGTGDIFYRTAAHLGSRYNVVTVGYPSTDDIAAMSHGLAALLDALQSNDAVILGSSLGGYLAQRFALDYPARVRLLLLGNTFRDPSSQQTRWPPAAEFAQTAAETVLSDARTRLLAGPAEDPPAAELKAALLALVGTEQDAAAVKAQRMTVLRAITLPEIGIDRRKIALIDDDHDPVIAPATREDLRRTYADCRQMRIAGGGHYPSVLAPGLYHATLDALLAEVSC
jgi:maspardin